MKLTERKQGRGISIQGELLVRAEAAAKARGKTFSAYVGEIIERDIAGGEDAAVWAVAQAADEAAANAVKTGTKHAGKSAPKDMKAEAFQSLFREAQRNADEAAALRAENERLRSVMLCASSHETIVGRLDRALRRMERGIRHPEALAAWRNWLAEGKRTLLGVDTGGAQS